MSKEEKSLKSWLKAGRAAYSVSDACGEAGKRIATVGAIILLGGALAAIFTDFCYNRDNPFVPKPFTPFQWAPFAGKKYLDAAIKLLRRNLRGVEIISESVRSATVQAILSRGDENLSDVLSTSTSESDFRRNFKSAGLDENFYLGARSVDEMLPWDVLDQGFAKSYLVDEFNRASAGKLTVRCFDGCKRCGVCE